MLAIKGTRATPLKGHTGRAGGGEGKEGIPYRLLPSMEEGKSGCGMWRKEREGAGTELVVT